MADAPEPLPHAPIERVLGLLDHLREAPDGREDLYKLGDPLGYQLDELLPVIDVGKRLGLVQVAAGDIELTPEGRTLAAAEAPDRKRLLSTRVGALPVVGEIRRALLEGEGHVARQSFLERLREYFSPAEAERQLQTALAWGRYVEVFDFDPDAEEFVLAS
jgi:NitT/TauT family transport system ATP-binding protein